MKRVSLVKALSFATLCLLVATSCNQKSTTDKPKPNGPSPDFTVAATDLSRETLADYHKAESKYAGKQIAVLGRVSNVNLGGNPMIITLAPGVSALFDEKERESLSSIKEGQIVRVQCLGGKSWMSPDLTHCTIINDE